MAPPGATLLPRNFRKALLVGRELANAVVALLAGPRAVAVEPTSFDVRTADEYTYLSNPLFRLGNALALPAPFLASARSHMGVRGGAGVARADPEPGGRDAAAHRRLHAARPVDLRRDAAAHGRRVRL